MTCGQCKHAIVGKTRLDKEMAAIGYKTCALARDEVERAMFAKGHEKCRWFDRKNETLIKK